MVYMRNPYLQERQFVALDLETVPVEDDAVRAEIAAGIAPPGNMSKPETIAAWERDRKPQLVEEAFGRGGLSATTGRICCIGIASATFEHTFCGPDEAELIHLAYEFLSTLGEPVTYVGHNLQGFDLPFLRMRSIIHRRKPPLSLRKAMSAKPWDNEVIADTMLQWSHDRDKRISLDRLCRLLGIESPKVEGIDGSAVYGLYTAGKLQDIADYCLRDCRAALAVYNRIAEVA
jgi:3'-5' exonuclease